MRLIEAKFSKCRNLKCYFKQLHLTGNPLVPTYVFDMIFAREHILRLENKLKLNQALSCA